MQDHINFYTIRKTTLAMATLFDELVVKRYGGETTAQKTIAVPLRIMTREKAMERLMTYDSDPPGEAGKLVSPQPILPMMSLMLTDLSPRLEDQSGPYEKRTMLIEYDNNGTIDYVKRGYGPSPWDYTFSLSLWTRKVGDLFQLLENILPFFTTPPTIRYTDQQSLAIERDLPISLTSTSINIPDEAEGIRAFKDTTLTFVVKGWLYKTISVQGIIKTVTVNTRSYTSAVTDADGGSTLTITGKELEDGERIITETLAEYTA